MAEPATKMYSSELFSPKLLREKFENDLESQGNSGNLVIQKCDHPDKCSPDEMPFYAIPVR